MPSDIADKLKALVSALGGKMDDLTSYPLPPGSENIVPQAKEAYTRLGETFRGAMPRLNQATEAVNPFMQLLAEGAANSSFPAVGVIHGLPSKSGLIRLGAIERANRPLPAPSGSFRAYLDDFLGRESAPDNVTAYPFKTAAASRDAKRTVEGLGVDTGYISAQSRQTAARYGLTPEKAREFGLKDYEIPHIGQEIELFQKQLARADQRAAALAHKPNTKLTPQRSLEEALYTLERIERRAGSAVDTSSLRRDLMRYRARYGE